MTPRRTPQEQQRAFEAARLVATRAWAFVGCAAVFVIVLAGKDPKQLKEELKEKRREERKNNK